MVVWLTPKVRAISVRATDEGSNFIPEYYGDQ
jgi:hypothetical protein